MAETLERRRFDYAEHLVACMDTVVLARVDEVASIHARAEAGEFDEELDWRSPYLNRKGEPRG